MTDQAPASGQGTSTSASLFAPPLAAAPAAPAVPGTTSQPATPAAAAPGVPWLENADEVTAGYVQNKGWQKPEQVLESYRNLEKLMGADRAGNTVVMPKPDASPEEFGKFFDRLGRPATPGDYKLEVPAIGGDPKFAEIASKWFHDEGLNTKQAQNLASKFNAFVGEKVGANAEQLAAAYASEDKALRDSWGVAFNQELALAQAFVRGAGIAPEVIDKLQASMGHKATMEFFNAMGKRMGEADFVGGNRTQAFGNALTPGQAKAKITELTQDKNFVIRYRAKDASAVAEMKQLHEYAFPGGESE